MHRNWHLKQNVQKVFVKYMKRIYIIDLNENVKGKSSANQYMLKKV